MTPLYTTAPRQRNRRPARVLLVAALVTVTIALTATITYSTRSGKAHPPAEPTPIPTAWSGTPSGRPTPATTASCLAELADTLSASANPSNAASTTSASPTKYAHTHVRSWAAQDTLIPSGASSRTIVTTETWQWRAADGSGRTISTTPGSTGRTVTDHPAGGISAPLPEPTPDDPHTLTEHLAAVQPPVMGPQWIIRAVADVHLTQLPTLATRIALLRLVATAETAACVSMATDRAGRAGITVTVDHQQVRDTLIIDRAGWVLAHETTDLGAPPGMDKSAPHLRSYSLVVNRSQESTIGPAEATP